MANGGSDKFFAAIREVEKQRGCKIWCLIHGRTHICYPTMWSIEGDRHTLGRGKKIEILIHSGGGHPDIGFKVMKFFRRRFDEVNCIVPLYAKSSATLMCLGADHIYVGELADFGPIDIQIDDNYEHGGKSFSPLDEFKSIEFLRELSIEWMDYYASLVNYQYQVSVKQGLKDSVPLVTGLMKPIFAQIDPVKMGGYRRAIAIGEEYAKRMLNLVGNKNASKIVKEMVWEYPSHDFAIDFEEAKDLGLPVERLSESQDYVLSAAIRELGRDDYHGFVPPLQPASQQAGKPVRKVRTAGTSPKQRVNGSNGTRQEERVRTQGEGFGR